MTFNIKLTMQITIGDNTIETSKLPRIIREGVEALRDKMSAELFLCSGTTILSGLPIRVKGHYDNGFIYPNLYLMVLAPAGAGKGPMTDSLAITRKLEREIQAKNEELANEYKERLRLEKAKGKNVTAPPAKAVVIAGDTSAAMLFQQIKNNGLDTPTIIFETELDALANANKNEWGNFTVAVRQGFHNETIRMARMTSGQLYIEDPKMALCMSGTNNQFFNLINNPEDGLFSRFMLLTFEGSKSWRDVGPCESCMNKEEVLDQMSESGYQFTHFINRKPREVTLTVSQWKALNAFGETRLLSSRGTDANSKRHAVMIFKMCMTFTALRAWEANSDSDVLECNDDDFKLAELLALRSYDRSIEVHEQFRHYSLKVFEDRKRELLDVLPNEFQTKEALQLAMNLGKPQRTAERYLHELTQDGLLESIEKGKYRKVQRNPQ